jgi:hypothetical protein
MLRDLWHRIVSRRTESAERREEEREQMSPAERRFTGESVEDHAADELVEEHLGGVDPQRLDESDPPRY